MNALLIALVIATAPADEKLVPFKMPPVRISVPETFAHTEEGTTHHFISKDGEAFFDVDIGKVQTAGMKADVCLGKITRAIGGKFTKTKLGGQPGAKKVTTDKDAEKKEFVTTLFVGCDGQTTWSLSFHVPKAKQADYLPLATKIAESIEFPKAE